MVMTMLIVTMLRSMVVNMIVRIGNVVIVGVLVVMIVQLPLLACFLQFGFKQTPDRRVFLVLFNLFYFERNAKTLRKVSFRDRKIARHGHAGVEVLVKPEKRRRNDGAR